MTDDSQTTITLSREDALTLECEEYITEHLDDDEEIDYPDTESESEPEEDDDAFWPTDEQVAGWEEEADQWRNPDAYWPDDLVYDPVGEV